MKILIRLLALFLGVSPAARAAVCSATLPDDLCKLETLIYEHTDFRKTDDVRKVTIGLKDLLITHDDDSAVIRSHILALVDHVTEEANRVRAPKEILDTATGDEWLYAMASRLKEYEHHNGAVVPTDWELPDAIKMLAFVVEKSYEPTRDRTQYSFGLYGGTDELGVVESLQIVRYPNQVIADKQDPGAWHEDFYPASKSVLFSLGGSTRDAPLAEGLYLLNLKVKHQPMVKGWFILSRTTPTVVPVVKTPTLNEVFSSGTPKFRWVDFHSPQFRPFEHRKRTLSINSNNRAEKVSWRRRVINPRPATALWVGVGTDGLSPLKPGSYDFHATFEERWLAAGGFFLGRSSAIGVPFRVID